MQPVLILGAGINGAAVARDLAINGVPVCIVDRNDIAYGATSRSSRLIHGGLRYLEYRDVDLVRESLEERERLLRLAPQFVTPLRLAIPIANRLGGLTAGAVRFSGLGRTVVGQSLQPSGPRGLIAVQFGLSLYDRLAGRSGMPGHSTHRVGPFPDRPAVDPKRFRWLCAYSDAQIIYPERFVLALLHDAQRAADQAGSAFEVLTRHRAKLVDGSTIVEPCEDALNSASSRELRPSVIVNATGAWGDRTLELLGLTEPQPKLFAGTKGSHLFTTHRPLIDAMRGQGIYAEASDGRLVFILPCADGVLIGTTDEPFDESPDRAVATAAEVDYLIRMVNDIFPQVAFQRDHVEMHHAGVRPLPNVRTDAVAAIPRGHSIEETSIDDFDVLTLVGGKLTTCRALAEEVTDRVLDRLHRKRSESTRERLLPGASSEDSASDGLQAEQRVAVRSLLGNRLKEVFGQSSDGDLKSVPATNLPVDFVRWSIRNEWVTSLEDLVERRLMLIFTPGLQRSTLESLAGLLVEAGHLQAGDEETAVEKSIARLSEFYGKSVLSEDAK